MGELLSQTKCISHPVTNIQRQRFTSVIRRCGFNRMSQQFHNYIRQNVLSNRIISTPRPVHYNTWEGIYFDHDIEQLKHFADVMAELGAERFVLDDGLV